MTLQISKALDGNGQLIKSPAQGHLIWFWRGRGETNTKNSWLNSAGYNAIRVSLTTFGGKWAIQNSKVWNDNGVYANGNNQTGQAGRQRDELIYEWFGNPSGSDTQVEIELMCRNSQHYVGAFWQYEDSQLIQCSWVDMPGFLIFRHYEDAWFTLSIEGFY